MYVLPFVPKAGQLYIYQLPLPLSAQPDKQLVAVSLLCHCHPDVVTRTMVTENPGFRLAGSSNKPLATPRIP